MEILDLCLVSICTAFVYALLERYFGKGYVKRSEFNRKTYDYEEALKTLTDSFEKFRAKYSMRFGREEKDAQNQQLLTMLPSIIDKLPLPDAQKLILKQVPPEQLLGLAKKAGLI